MYSYCLRFAPRGREVKIADPAAAVEAWVSVDPRLPTTINVYPLAPKNERGGCDEPSQLTVSVKPEVWDHNRARQGRFVGELVKGLYGHNHEPSTLALRQSIVQRAMATVSWTPLQQPQFKTQTQMQLVEPKQAKAPAAPAESPDRLMTVLEKLSDAVLRPVAPPNVTIAEGAVQVSITNQPPGGGDLEVEHPDGRRTRIRRR